jgi:signal peptidase I
VVLNNDKIEIIGHEPTATQKKRVRREAAALAAAARKSLRRHGMRVPERQRDEITRAADLVDEALARSDDHGVHDLICQRMVVLQELVDEHLGFAKKSVFREYFDSIGVAVLVALMLRAFVVEAFKIPSGSMIPTLAVGDHIFVNKFLYGLHIPFTKIKFFEWRKPKRGEVIVFIYPVEPDKDFIKRIIAVEGDSVEVRHAVVYVNGKAIEHKRLPGEWTYWDFDETSSKWSQKTSVREEEVLDGHHYITLHDPHPLEDFGGYRWDFPEAARPYIVPKDSVFVLGDNRENSHDSRFWGPVPLENIRGEALVVWYSQGEPEGIRWNRVGHLVE